MFRPKSQFEITDPLVSPGRLLDILPAREAPNFKSAEPAYLGGLKLNRVFDNVNAYEAGGYWSLRNYQSEATWRSGVAVPENWNKGTFLNEWQPDSGWGWGGRAAPQAVPGYSTEKLGFQIGWIQKGGDYQIWAPKILRNDIPTHSTPSAAPWWTP
jgi:hypothetical protein